jgi:ubiquitin-conjugating enzyme E2 Q
MPRPGLTCLPDTTEYPKSHSLFCYASDGDISPRLQEVIEDFATEPAHSVRETLLVLLSRISRAVGLCTTRPATNDEGEDTEEVDEEDEEDYSMLSDDDEAYHVDSFTVIPTNQCDLSVLQRSVVLVLPTICFTYYYHIMTSIPQ